MRSSRATSPFVVRLVALGAVAALAIGCTTENPNYVPGDGGVGPVDVAMASEPDLATLPTDTPDLARLVDLAVLRDLAIPTCGVPGKPCCNGQCQSGSICNFGTCTACGAASQACCANQSCGSALVCNFNQCQPCGNLYQSCCAGQKCGLGATCSFGQCQPCGNANETCCANSTCGAGTVCQLGQCRVCGQQGQACCQNNLCGTNLVCAGIGIQQCTTCGGQAQPCCPNDSCPRSQNHRCNNGMCN